jgi:diguanylate cyclase (GGDEF)-like protein
LNLSRTTITFRAITFVLGVCIALVALDGWRSWNARTVQLGEMRVATSNLTRAMAQQANDTIKEADTTLVGTVERVQVDGLGTAAVARLHRILVLRKEQLRQLNGLFIYDEKGDWIANSEPTLLKAFNNADREYFVFHRTHADLGPHIGVPVQSRSTGKWVIPVSRRIDKPDGSFGGVVLATIGVDFFKAFYDSLEIGKLGAAALVSDSGVMMLRRPYDDRFIGKSIVGTELFHYYQTNGPSGTSFVKSSQDGVKRLNSYRRLQDYPLFVVAALSENEILREWWHDTLLHMVGVLCLALVVGLFGLHLIRQIALRSKAELELIKARDALEKLNATLERLAMQDGLTGLANRRQFDVSLSNEFSRAVRQASTLALIMMDVDYFKQYNDIYGHAAGDECLRTISRLIRDLTPHRPGDLAARYGGEEIALLLPNTDVAGAVVVAEKIRLAIRALGIVHSGNPSGFVTISAGVDSRVPERLGGEPTALIKAADKALYEAKRSGRDRVNFSHPSEQV